MCQCACACLCCQRPASDQTVLSCAWGHNVCQTQSIQLSLGSEWNVGQFWLVHICAFLLDIELFILVLIPLRHTMSGHSMCFALSVQPFPAACTQSLDCMAGACSVPDSSLCVQKHAVSCYYDCDWLRSLSCKARAKFALWGL